MLLVRVFVLIATFILGSFAAWLFSGVPQVVPDTTPLASINERTGSGHSGKHPQDAAEPVPGQPPYTSPLKITHKHKPQYTDDARTNGIEGSVTLRVVFLASGGIGAITVVKGLPHGLTEQAIAAARQIRFEPEIQDGRARTTLRTVTYTFDIY